MAKRGLVLYLHVHQPYRIDPYTVFDTGNRHNYFSLSDQNRQIFNKVAQKSYRPMNALLQKLLQSQPDFKISLSISGTFIEQAKQFAPDVLESFQQLAKSSRVEILAETYHHSLAFFYSLPEFERQVNLHKELIFKTFGKSPRAFRGTELAYNDDLALWAEKQGYEAILAEGWDPILEWRSPNFVYQPSGTQNIKLLLKNYRLSDDLAFRFSDRKWAHWPLTAQKFNDWADKTLGDQQVLNLFMDYETFGEHQWQDTGIFNFFEDFIAAWAARADSTFYNISEAAKIHPPAGQLSIEHTLTWADSSRDLSAWNGNNLQREALRYIYNLEKDILLSQDQSLINDWRHLQTSDHFYYMCTKGFTDGEVHEYFSPYQSPYEAFLYYLNAVRDLRWRLHVNHHAGSLNG